MKTLLGALAVAVLLQAPPALTGEQQIERLKGDATRSSALYQLLRGEDTDAGQSEAEFRSKRRNPELVICPQGEGKPPIYVVLSDFLTRDENQKEGDDALFKAIAPKARKKKKVIDAFTAAGKVIKPFGGNNVVDDGLFGDLNKDGRVLKADGGGYSLRGSDKHVSVVEVSVVREKAERIFAVVYQFGKWDSWGYDFSDENGDGIPEIQLGPKTLDDEVVPQVSYKWDPAKQAYVGPPGGASDHFRVIDPVDIWKELKRLQSEKVEFPAEEHRARAPKKPVALQDADYRYASLKGRPDKELFAYMARAREEHEWRPLEEPAGFWTLAPKAAALALVEANRSTKHKAQAQIAIDDRDGIAPGEAGTLRFTSESSRCYFASDTHTFLRFGPKDCFLVVAHTVAPGVVAAERGSKVRSQAVRSCTLEPAEARHIAHVIWWLNRIRTKSSDLDRFNSGFSTADGRGSILLQFADGKPAVQAEGRIWSGSIFDRWTSLYTPDAYINFAEELLGRTLILRAGARLAPMTVHTDREEMAPAFEVKGLEAQAKACSRILELHQAEPGLMAAAMVDAAYDVAGELALASLVPLLEQLKGRDSDAKNAEAALRRIGAVKDSAALGELALSKDAKADWALQQIKLRFPETYPRTLEARFKVVQEGDAARVLSELAGVDVERARALAATVPPVEDGSLGRTAFALLRDAPAMGDEAARVKAQLDVALDATEKGADRSASIDALVPAQKPLRFPSKDIDDALERILKAPVVRGVLDFTSSHAMAALERRRGAQYFDSALARLKETQDSFVVQQLLGTVSTMAQQGSGEQRAQLAAYFRAQLQQTDLMMTELCWEIWAADLRELKGDLERLATSGPGAQESERANTAGGGVKPVSGKFHKARQVAQLWNEEDALTRAKLTVALALDEAYAFTGTSHPSRRRRFEQALAAAAKELSVEQRKAVVEFAAAFAPKSVASETGPLLGIVREALK